MGEQFRTSEFPVPSLLIAPNMLEAMTTFASRVCDFIKEKEGQLLTKRPVEIECNIDNSNNFNIIFEYYSNLYKAFGVRQHVSFENNLNLQLQRFHEDTKSFDFQAAIEQHKEIEKKWDSFLQKIDSHVGWDADSEASTLSSELNQISLESLLNPEKRVSLAELIFPSAGAGVFPKFTWIMFLRHLT